MSDLNSNGCSTINGAVGCGLPANGRHLETRSPLEVLRSLAADLRRPLRTVAAHLNGHSHEPANRNGLAPSVPPPSRPGSPPRGLSTVDSQELLREILRRVGDDPNREGLQETPARIVRSWKEIYGGYAQRAEDVLITQFQAEH